MRNEESYLRSCGKFLALILRHKPETVGITVDEHGWADVQELLKGVNEKKPLTMEQLEKIVETDNKQRYSFNEDHTKIRANQGHSIPVDVDLRAKEPPEVLFHGTGEHSVSSIDEKGLLPMSRLYVHLSEDVGTALAVGRRHGRPVVYTVKAGEMATDGYEFFLSVNGVWLTKEVPPEYLLRD